jgi:hypothetical protein
MALIEMDESWEQYDEEEQRRLEEKFPVIEDPMVKAQITSWDIEDVPKLGSCIQLTFTVIEHPKYTGVTLRKPLPLQGRMKFITKNFMDAMKLPRKGKQIDPEPWVGLVANLILSVTTNPETGRKFTRIDSAVRA